MTAHRRGDLNNFAEANGRRIRRCSPRPTTSTSSSSRGVGTQRRGQGRGRDAEETRRTETTPSPERSVGSTGTALRGNIPGEEEDATDRHSHL